MRRDCSCRNHSLMLRWMLTTATNRPGVPWTVAALTQIRRSRPDLLRRTTSKLLSAPETIPSRYSVIRFGQVSG